MHRAPTLFVAPNTSFVLRVCASVAALLWPIGVGGAAHSTAAASPPRFLLTDLGTLPGGTESAANAINDSGIVVGRAAISQAGTPNDAAMWVDGAFVPLESVGFGYDTPFDINDAGEIVGTAFDGVAYGAVHWSDGSPTVLPSLGGFITEAYAINSAGLVAGYSTSRAGTPRATCWTDGELTELPALTHLFAMAYDLNDSGWIVGTAAPSAGPARAVLWIDGVLHDLSECVVNAAATLVEAKGINAAGQIVGRGQFADGAHAFLLTPVAPADLNADGVVDGADLGILLAAWGPCAARESCVSDLNGDGIVDGADLGLLLAAWGAPPT